MAVEVRVPTVLRKHTGGARVVESQGKTVAEVIDHLEQQFPGLKGELLNESGQMRQFVNIYVNDEDIRYLDRLETAISEGDQLAILPAVAGGARPPIPSPLRGEGGGEGRRTSAIPRPAGPGGPPSPFPLPGARGREVSSAPCASILDAIGNTPLVELKRFSPKEGVRIFAKLEGHNPTGSVKDRIALTMVDQAERDGALSPGCTLLEPTSGNTGVSLAMVCRIRGYRLIAVMPENVSDERRQVLRAFGAEIVLTEGLKGSNGAIEVAQRMAAEHREYVMLYQYGNPANPRAHYETTAPEILEALPDVTTFVAGLGTAGTLMGVSRRLKEHDARIQIIAAEPNLGDLVQGLRNLDEGFVPPILDLALLDRKMVVSSEDGIRYTQELLQREGIFAGVSSGAVLSCALRVAQRMDRGNIVVLFADGGWKYLSAQIWTKSTEQASADLQDQLLW